MQVVCTVGFTKKTLESFVTLIRGAGVATVVDVRLRNSSQLAGWSKYPDFPFLLKEGFGIGYEHHPELAPTAELLDRYKKDGDWLRYEMDFRQLLEDRAPIEQCQQLLSDGTICLLCTEITADRCHRRLVAEYMQEIGGPLQIRHL